MSQSTEIYRPLGRTLTESQGHVHRAALALAGFVTLPDLPPVGLWEITEPGMVRGQITISTVVRADALEARWAGIAAVAGRFHGRVVEETKRYNNGLVHAHAEFVYCDVRFEVWAHVTPTPVDGSPGDLLETDGPEPVYGEVPGGGLSQPQLDGFACVVCGVGQGPGMAFVPAGFVRSSGQVFRCADGCTVDPADPTGGE